MATTKILGQEINALTATTASFALAAGGGGLHIPVILAS